MSKKKFKDGLESLFLDAQEDSLSKDSAQLLESGQQQEASKQAGKHSLGKHFSDELELFFQEALQEEQASDQPRRSSKPKNGLDTLIRLTLESADTDLHYDESKKRIAFSFNEEDIAKLKKIARMEKTLLKDMIARVVANYIKEYEQKTKL